MNLSRPASFGDGNGFISVAGPHHVMNFVEQHTDELVDEIIQEAFDRDGNGFISVAGPHHVMNLVELLTDEEVDELIREAVWHFQADFSAFFGLRLRPLIPHQKSVDICMPQKTCEKRTQGTQTQTQQTQQAQQTQ